MQQAVSLASIREIVQAAYAADAGLAALAADESHYRHSATALQQRLFAEQEKNAALVAEHARLQRVSDEYFRMMGEEVGKRRDAERQLVTLREALVKRHKYEDWHSPDDGGEQWCDACRALAATAPKEGK